MSLYIDHQYIAEIGSRLERFKRKSQKLYNFRCPICGDSEKSKTKARGYFYQKGNDMFFRCHNCMEGMSFSTFLKRMDHALYEQYIFDRYKTGETGHSNYQKPKFEFKWNKPKVDKNNGVSTNHIIGILADYICIAECERDHLARQYVENRQIPEKFYNQLFYVPDFKELVDKFEPDNEYGLYSGDKRLVIPFFGTDASIIALQGRTLSGSHLRYITIKVDKDAPKIFGLDRVNPDKRIYVVEGPIDSMFLGNTIATAGASITTTDLHNVGNDLVFVYDNERRKKSIVEAMVKMADAGEKVCVWPETVVEKDINDMVIAGRSPREILEIIENNTYEGLNARIAISGWRRC